MAEKFTQLPPAGSITGAEILALVQGDASKQATAAAVVNALLALVTGAPNGVATLDSAGKLDGSQIPAALLGSVSYQGTWDASSGSAPSATPTKGQYWVVSVAGSTSLGGITDWKIGDWAIYDTAWDKVDNTDGVASVAGLTGIITAAALRTALALATVATSGSYNDLLNLPTLGSAAAADFQAMPFVNVMPDSGKFGGIADPLALQLPSPFAVQSLFFTPANGATVTNDGSKFIYNNTTNGGSAGNLTEPVTSLLTKLGRSGGDARYGTEFYVAQITVGAGTANPLATPDGTLYQVLNNLASFMSAKNDMTYVAWMRCRSGGSPLYFLKRAQLYIDGMAQPGNAKLPDNDWHHVRAISGNVRGYDAGFPFLYSGAGTIIDVALVGYFTGLVDVGIHTAPLKTINALSGGQPAPMPLAGGAFAGPVAVSAYTKATLPSAATYNGYLVRVSDATGGTALCMSNGTNWIDIHTGSPVA